MNILEANRVRMMLRWISETQVDLAKAKGGNTETYIDLANIKLDALRDELMAVSVCDIAVEPIPEPAGDSPSPRTPLVAPEVAGSGRGAFPILGKLNIGNPGDPMNKALRLTARPPAQSGERE